MQLRLGNSVRISLTQRITATGLRIEHVPWCDVRAWRPSRSPACWAGTHRQLRWAAFRRAMAWAARPRRRFRRTRCRAWRLPGTLLGPSAACVPAPKSERLSSAVSGRIATAGRIARFFGRLDGCGLLRFRGCPSDERGPGHQIECGIIQYRDLAGRHMAPKTPFRRAATMSRLPRAGAPCRSMSGRQGIAPNPLTQ